MAELDRIVEQLSKLTVIEMTELTTKLENKWKVSASVPTTASNPSEHKVESQKEKEKLEYDLVLEAAGDKKISVIKEIKNITGFGLKEARDFVQSVPKVVKTSLPKEEAEALKTKLESVGAQVTLK